ncbi:hypothetical protein F5Y04DRAFT_8301 [Hypomontagnella monticulosa]|nr:hypothetical protein F5Y04DRAFT_8301 [Hypomontagnella monticulosa]
MVANTEGELPHRGRQNRRYPYKPRSNYQKKPKPAPIRVRGDPYQSVTALQLGLHPRSFEDLHEERKCLVDTLQQLDQRALELFSLVPILDEVMLRAPTDGDWQRAKKQRGWLKQRIVDTVEHEKRILGRLSELHVEIQCRERWAQVERDRQVLSLGQYQRQDRYAAYNASLMPMYQPVQHDEVNLSPNHLFEKHGFSDYTGGLLQSWYPVYEYYGNEYPGSQCYEPQYYEPQYHEPGPFELEGTINDADYLPDKTAHHSSPMPPKNSAPEPKKQSSMPSLRTAVWDTNEINGESSA